MSRWKMHKLGFVNFWLYDKEEFLLENGHILLRGENASGKSITTQSFVPFILDGNKSPERLDPFGSRDRKMEFYLLGENESEEATGYLYLEFKKDDAESYLTIGIGMRAQRGKGIDFWGFCLNDGRRIGSDGVQLYEQVGKQLLPLSKQKLKNLLADPENWANAPGEYQRLVNTRLFQFRDLRQYDQLISLLIKVRAPKLSKEAFRPSEVKKILNESLQVLTNEDLAAMVQTMERMDELEDTLRELRSAQRDAMTIRNEYTRYNQFILGKKGRAYTEACQHSMQVRNQLEDVESRCQALQRELSEQEKARDGASLALTQAMAQRTSMGEDDLSIKREQLQQALNSCAAYQRDLNEGTEALQKTREKITDQEIRLREQQRAVRDGEVGLRMALRRLGEINGVLELGDAHDAYVRALQTAKLTEEEQILRSVLFRQKKQIKEVLSCLDKLELARAEYDASCQRLDEAATKEEEAERSWNDARQQEQEERDSLLERFAVCLSNNQQLTFSKQEALSLKQAVAHYRSSADWSAIRESLDRKLHLVYQTLIGEETRREKDLQSIEDETREAQKQLRNLRSQPVPQPRSRREQVNTTRSLLILRGLRCVPLYETIDFSPELSQAERDLLEAQLMDAGLLDALLIPEEERTQVEDLLQADPDSFLVPGPAVDDPITALIPDRESEHQALALACLRGISRSDLGAETALLPDGRFRSGMLRGHSHAEQPAGFVGAAARRANRERQIQSLEAHIAQLERKLAEQQAALERIGAAKELLQQERDQMPTAVDLDHALEMLEQARRDLSEAAQLRERRAIEEQAAKSAQAHREQEVRSLSQGLPYARSKEAYQEAEDAAEDYQNQLSEVQNTRAQLQNDSDRVLNTESSIDQQREYAERQERRNRRDQENLAREQAKAAALQQFLELPENRDRTRRLEELEREIDAQKKRHREADNACVRLTEQLSNAKSVSASRRQQLTEAILDEEDLRRYFVEELELGLSEFDPDDLAKAAREAFSRLQAADRDRMQTQLDESLQKNYQEHNNSLLKYQPKIALKFDPPIRQSHLRQRLCITLQKDGKELSLPAFLRELQADIEMTSAILEEKDRDLFENILTETISHKLRARVEESRRWTEDMTALMQTLDTSMGLTFSLEWKPKRAESEQEMDTAQLVTLLNRDRALLTREDSQKVSAHFRAKVKKAREEAAVNDIAVNYADLIRTVLDYRTWYEFHLYYHRGNEPKKELTDRAFNRFSGGEKAMAMYVPLFAAVSAQYQKGSRSCPMLIALDEAFAGVDDRNIGAMFELVRVLQFDYIMNSQVLWGCYPGVEDLDIVELHRPGNAQIVTVLHYHWNGKQRLAAEGSL